MKKTALLIGLLTATFSPLFLVNPAHADACVSSYQSQTIAAATGGVESVEPTVTTLATCGGDDVSYEVPLTVDVTFDGQQFSSVYATTNSVITFGRPDGTYWDYPQTPSVSLYSMDWVVYPQWRSDEHLIIAASDGGFQVDISARPIWLQSAPEATNIVITAAINSDGTVAISYALTGPDYAGYPWIRTGVRLVDGSVVSLEEYGIVQVEEAPVLTPEPVAPEPSPQPSPEPVPEPEPQPEPVRPEPVAPPQPEPAAPEPIAPAPEPVAPEPVAPEPVQPAPEPPAPAPEPEPTVEPEPIPVLPEPPIEQPLAEQLWAAATEDDIELPSELAAIPLLGDALAGVVDAVNFIGNVGADMTPEARQTAQETVVASIVVSQIAQTASLSATTSSTTGRRNETK